MDTRFFEFDGVKSTEMGVYIVRVEESGVSGYPIWSAASISSTKNKTQDYMDFS